MSALNTATLRALGLEGAPQSSIQLLVNVLIIKDR